MLLPRHLNKLVNDINTLVNDIRHKTVIGTKDQEDCLSKSERFNDINMHSITFKQQCGLRKCAPTFNLHTVYNLYPSKNKNEIKCLHHLADRSLLSD